MAQHTEFKMSRSFLKTPGTDRVTVAPTSSINNLSKRTVMCWINPTTRGGNNFGTVWSRTVNSYSEFSLTTNFVSNVQCASAGAFYYNAYQPPFSMWSHYAFTYDDTGSPRTPLAYFGGQTRAFYGSVAGSGSLTDDSSTDLVIGRYQTSSLYTWDGLIYDWRVYNSILTQAQIQAIIAGGPKFDPLPANNVCHLTFATNQGNTEPDTSGNSNVGVISGATFNSNNPVFSTVGCVGIGRYFGNSLAEVAPNPYKMDLFQVINQSGVIVWNLDYAGTENINPASPTSQALLGRYEGQSFVSAFPNPDAQNVFQVVNGSGSVVFAIDSTGNAGPL